MELFGRHNDKHSAHAHDHNYTESERSPFNGAEACPVSYVNKEDHFKHENEYIHFATRLFGTPLIFCSQDNHKTKKMRSDFELEERISEEDYTDAEDECIWTPMPDSIVALNLTMACAGDLTDDTWKYIRSAFFCGLLPLAMTFIIELTTLAYLWEDNSDLTDADGFCAQHPIMQLAVITIFALTLQTPLSDIMTEAAVGFSSTKMCFNAEDGACLFIHGTGISPGKDRDFYSQPDKPLIIKEVKTSSVSFWIFWTAVVLEFGVWALTCYVGVFYTLSQVDASEIVQSAVAISFINEIDNMVYASIVSEDLKDFLATVEFRIPAMKSAGKNSFYTTVARLCLQTPLLCMTVYYVVFHLRNKHCDPITGEPITDGVTEWHAVP